MGLVMATMPLAGCLLGFLRYNFNPASVFLGDCGSLSIGFFLGCCGAIWSQKAATLLGMTAPLMAFAIPLLDAALAIGRRFLRNQPIFGADRRHIHHLLLDRGMTPRRVALLVYGICGLAAICSLLQSADHFGGMVIVLFCVAAWVGVQNLGYSEFGLAKRLLFGGTFRQIIDVQFRLKQFEDSLSAAVTLDQSWRVLQSGCQEFGFASLRVVMEGQIFESPQRQGPGDCFQIRIPLSDRDYVNLVREYNKPLESSSVAGFAEIVYKVLSARLSQLGAEAAVGAVGLPPIATEWNRGSVAILKNELQSAE
jgi:UDP-GlcNAc:undecaprenyl-phosphate/decaprenyl-phosphate GlcNAc-1-phosphate transferase